MNMNISPLDTSQIISLAFFQVGKMADFEIIRNSCGRQLSVAALVVARGSIHSSASVVFQSGSPITSFQVPVTPQLADRFCVLVYFLAVCNQVVADGCCVDTDKACSNEISLHLDKNTVEPGDTVAIDVNVDCPNSDIVLLAVDRGLYMLNKRTISLEISYFKLSIPVHVLVDIRLPALKGYLTL